MRRIRSIAGLVLAGSALAVGISAQSEVPAPADFHGYDLGTRYTITAGLYEYYRTLAERSPRVEYREYGRSLQGRPLPLVIVSSEENLARLGEIGADLRRLTRVTDPLPEDELSALVAGTPALVWIFIVDTDEEAGVEVLQEVAYELATADDPETASFRDSLVVLFAPLTNPDSHARYVAWHGLYDVDGAATDPNAIENDAHWGMNTDGNAVGIDVNRDFGWFVTPEMAALARTATEWPPQLWLDIHSGPNVIFIPPFPRPWNPRWPERAPAWWERLAERASENFGRRGWTFNSREGYEGVTSVGFGLSWGMLGPAVSGMLFESFGGRPGKTTAFRRDDGTIATMRMAMDRHALGIRSLLQVASENRDRLLRDAHDGVVAAVEKARASPIRAVAFPTEPERADPDKVRRLVERLTLQGVEVRRSPRAFSRRGAPLEGGPVGSRSLSAGTWIVDLVQPAARLAGALLRPEVIDESPPVEVPFRTRMPYYDVTWSALPLLFGVEAVALHEAPPASDPAAGAVRAPEPPEPTEPDVEALRAAAGRRIPGVVEGLARSEPPYAWLLPAGLESSYRIAIRLMEEGFRLRSFQAPFEVEGRRYGPGTWAALRGRNPEGLARRIGELAGEHGGTAIAVAGPFTDAGVTFGDERRLAAVPPPRIAVVADWPVPQDHVFGGIRNVLERDFGLAFSPVLLETINEADLSAYTAVVLPHGGMSIRGGPGFGRGYEGLLDLGRLRAYVRDGGTLVAVKGAAVEVAKDPVLGAGVEALGWAEEANGAIARAAWAGAGPPDSGLVAWRPGLDAVGRPLLGVGVAGPDGAFAAPAAYPVLLDVDPGGPAETLARYGPDPGTLVLDGFVTPSERERLAGRPFVVARRHGAGRVLYFADDPTYRGYWYGLNLLFLNALLLGPTLP